MNNQTEKIMNQNYNAGEMWQIVTAKKIIQSTICDYTNMAIEAGVKEGETFKAGIINKGIFHPSEYIFLNGKAQNKANIWATQYNLWVNQNREKYNKMSIKKLQSLKSSNEFEAEYIKRRIVYLSD